MSLTIELPPATERRLRERAEELGMTADALATDAIRRWLADDPSWDALLRPFRQSFAASGLSEEELDRMVDEARQEVWVGREAGGGPS